MTDWGILGDLGTTFSSSYDGARKRKREEEQNKAFGALADSLVAPPAAEPAPMSLASLGQPAAPAAPAAPTGGDPIATYSEAIGAKESGGRYDAVGPTHPRLGRALGKHQVMEANVGPWTQEVLGQALTPEQFLASPDAQEAVFRAKFGQSLAKFGNPQDAASVWFTGRPAAEGANARDSLGTTGRDYVADVMGRAGGKVASADPSFTPTTPQGRMTALTGQGRGDLDPNEGAKPGQTMPNPDEIDGGDIAVLEREMDPGVFAGATGPATTGSTRPAAASGALPAPPKAGDQQSRALVAMMLRDPATRPAGLQALLSMQRKGASAPFEYRGAIVQYDGDGKLMQVVAPRDDTTTINNRLVRKTDGSVIADFSEAGGKDKGQEVTAVVAARQKEAERLGMKANDAGYQSFVLTGKMPREDAQPLSASDKKAIQDADESIGTTENTIGMLKKAKELSKTAYAGPAAAWRGWGGSLVGAPGAADTTELDNVLTTQAVGQLKQIFGGNPTEGERKVLLDIQASSSQPDEVRQRVYDRAIGLAEKRLEFQRQKSNELRGQTYYKPGGGRDPGAVGGEAAAGRKDLPKGYSASRALAEAKGIYGTADETQKAAIRQRLQSYGIDPARLD
jgi:hypothetical protein